MALTQKMLKALGVDDEDKREQILDEHQSVLREIREERDRLKDEAAKVPELQRQLEEAAKDGGEEWRAKYEEEQKRFSEYRDKVESERTQAEVARAYREQVLQAAGVDPRRLDSIMRLQDLSGIELEDGKVKDADKLVEGVKSEWSDFIVRNNTSGANVANPPNGGDDESPQPSEIAMQVIRERQSRMYGNDDGGSE